MAALYPGAAPADRLLRIEADPSAGGRVLGDPAQDAVLVAAAAPASEQYLLHGGFEPSRRNGEPSRVREGGYLIGIGVFGLIGALALGWWLVSAFGCSIDEKQLFIGHMPFGGQ
jgi:hypothetical protein